MKIELTEKEEVFLKLFASKQYSGAPDNLATCTPIHVVEKAKDVVVEDGYCYDKIYYEYGRLYNQTTAIEEIVADYYANYDAEMPFEHIIEYNATINQNSIIISKDGNKHLIFDESDYLQAYGVPNDYWHAVHTKTFYYPEAFFFILDEAKRYLDYQSHNLRNARIMTYNLGYSNYGDMPVFRNLLLNMGQKLLESDGALDSEKQSV